ncbi:nuclear transport factor 2 family protein [Martelella lutilitoris]|uniref:Nuclear transport factor 2 family protein n=1 Tax=Martelella lutilitoris TaxID=2583532 RepID=A0A7T7KKE8_9HYPH|nr:nuclear transport factor 2 family protein [Martelella lutilitoris]QQM29612.1 nuclear transport factor 2 family protein [Martelella lutilitoris]
MSSSIDQFPSLSTLLRQALGDALALDASTLLDMCAEDVVFEFPYHPPGFTERLEGRAALEIYLPIVSKLISIESVTLHEAFISARGDMAAIEFSCKGHSPKTGARYDQDYVSIIGLRDGRITRYRDYWNPLVVLSAIEIAPSVDAQ